MMKVVLDIDKLGKWYLIRPQRGISGGFYAGLGRMGRRLGLNIPPHRAKDGIWALQDVSFQVGKGEILGIIGPNGAGKTTLLKILARVSPPTLGHAKGMGRVVSLLELGMGFQPDLSGIENLYLNAAMHGIQKRDVDQRVGRIVEFAGLERFIDTPVKHYSSGMYLRLAFSVAINMDPDILLADEVLAVGDIAFQERCIDRVIEASRQGTSVLFVSHDMAAISRICDRVLWLDEGRIVMLGEPDKVVSAYEEQVMGGRGLPAISKASEWKGAVDESNAVPSTMAGDDDEDDAEEWAHRKMVQKSPKAFAKVSDVQRNKYIELVSMDLVSDEGRPIGAVDSSQPLNFQLVVNVHRTPINLRCWVALFRESKHRILLFRATQPPTQIIDRPSRHVITLSMPGDILNSGPYYVGCHAVAFVGEERHRLSRERGIAFKVYKKHDAELSDPADPFAGRPELGVIWPELQWTSRELEDDVGITTPC